MTVWLRFLVVVAKLDDDVVAWTHALQHPIPSALSDEGEGRTSVDCVVVDTDVLTIEALLQHHAPPSFLLAACRVLVGHSGVANHKNGDHVRLCRSCEQKPRTNTKRQEESQEAGMKGNRGAVAHSER